MNSISSACFFGIYMKKKNKSIYIAYKFIKNAFNLTPNIFVVTQS
jgi:hypothetical protein